MEARGLSISELAWWLLCQVEMECNRRIYPGRKNQVMPGISIKHWLRCTDSTPALNAKDRRGAAFRAAIHAAV